MTPLFISQCAYYGLDLQYHWGQQVENPQWFCFPMVKTLFLIAC